MSLHSIYTNLKRGSEAEEQDSKKPRYLSDDELNKELELVLNEYSGIGKEGKTDVGDNGLSVVNKDGEKVGGGSGNFEVSDGNKAGESRGGNEGGITTDGGRITDGVGNAVETVSSTAGQNPNLSAASTNNFENDNVSTNIDPEITKNVISSVNVIGNTHSDESDMKIDPEIANGAGYRFSSTNNDHASKSTNNNSSTNDGVPKPSDGTLNQDTSSATGKNTGSDSNYNSTSGDKSNTNLFENSNHLFAQENLDSNTGVNLPEENNVFAQRGYDSTKSDKAIHDNADNNLFEEINRDNSKPQNDNNTRQVDKSESTNFSPSESRGNANFTENYNPQITTSSNYTSTNFEPDNSKFEKNENINANLQSNTNYNNSDFHHQSFSNYNETDKNANTDFYSQSNNFSDHFPDERENLALIADQLAAATESNKTDKEKPVRTILHDGIHIPEDSELLNTNAAVAAYNALSSQLPSFLGANAHLAALPLPIVAEDYLPPRIQLLVNTLPTLDNLASQLLRIVAIGPYQKIIDIASKPDTPAGATFRDLSSLFEFTRRLYSEDIPFLTVEHIAPGVWKEGDMTPSMFKIREQSIESTLRKVNLATFLSATLGTIDAGFFYLNESFMDIFCPTNNLDPSYALSNITTNSMALQSGVNTIIGEKVGKMLKPQAELYLDLKTQAYISALEAGDRTKLENLNDLIPDDLERFLASRRGVKTLSPTELDFVERCKARKEILLNYPDDKDLSEEYEWFQFVKDLFDYVGKNMGFIIYGKKGRVPSAKKELDVNTPHSQEIINHYKEQRLNTQPTPELPNQISSEVFNEMTNSLLPSEIQEQQIHIKLNPRGASSKNLQRRPWTREEEKALRHALELKGPQWSTILELFGNGGTISEALKNRTQVQLKDKARNWKMFFLKNGLPVPGYLQRVTGDLDRQEKTKTTRRGPRTAKTAAAPVPGVQQHQ